MARIGTVVVLVGLVLALGLLARPAPADEDVSTIEVSTPLAIEDFLKTVQPVLGEALVWDPKSRALQGKQIVGDVRLSGTRAEILSAVRSLLTFYELVMVPVGAGENTKYIILDARQSAAILRLKPLHVTLTDENVADYESQDGLFLTTTLNVQNMPPESLRDARTALSRIVTGQNIGSVTEVPGARAFVVTDFAPTVVSIYRLLKAIDVPIAERGPEAADKEVVFRSIELQHARAEETARLLAEHFRANEPLPVQARPGQPPRPLAATPEDELRIHADARLNQVLVTGMRRDVERVAEAVNSIDRPRPASAAQVQVIRLEHIDAVGAAHALTDLIRSAPAAWRAEPGVVDLPSVRPHPETNALLLHAGEPAAGVLRRVITEMDRDLESEEDEASTE